MNDDIEQLGQRIDGMSADIRLIKKHLIGESEPEHSILFKVARHEQEIEELRESKAKAIGLGWASLTAAASAAGLWAWSRLTGHQQ